MRVPANGYRAGPSPNRALRATLVEAATGGPHASDQPGGAASPDGFHPGEETGGRPQGAHPRGGSLVPPRAPDPLRGSGGGRLGPAGPRPGAAPRRETLGNPRVRSHPHPRLVTGGRGAPAPGGPGRASAWAARRLSACFSEQRARRTKGCGLRHRIRGGDRCVGAQQRVARDDRGQERAVGAVQWGRPPREDRRHGDDAPPVRRLATKSRGMRPTNPRAGCPPPPVWCGEASRPPTPRDARQDFRDPHPGHLQRRGSQREDKDKREHEAGHQGTQYGKRLTDEDAPKASVGVGVWRQEGRRPRGDAGKARPPVTIPRSSDRPTARANAGASLGALVDCR